MNNIIDINSLNSTTTCNDSDLIHIIREDNEIKLLLSNKAKIKCLDQFLIRKNKLTVFTTLANSISSQMANLSTQFQLKTDMDNDYAKIVELEREVPKWITDSEVKSIMEKYAISNDLKIKSALAREQSYKLAEEMTDFGAAALVGIYQSMQTEEEPPPPSG